VHLLPVLRSQGPLNSDASILGRSASNAIRSKFRLKLGPITGLLNRIGVGWSAVFPSGQTVW
jgi:hypothetical protein